MKTYIEGYLVQGLLIDTRGKSLGEDANYLFQYTYTDEDGTIVDDIIYLDDNIDNLTDSIIVALSNKGVIETYSICEININDNELIIEYEDNKWRYYDGN